MYMQCTLEIVVMFCLPMWRGYSPLISFLVKALRSICTCSNLCLLLLVRGTTREGSKGEFFFCFGKVSVSMRKMQNFAVWYIINADVQLVGGSVPHEGRMELYLGARGWFTTCDVTWTILDATVVCRQLGYPGVAFATLGAEFGRSTEKHLLARTWNCTGCKYWTPG